MLPSTPHPSPHSRSPPSPPPIALTPTTPSDARDGGGHKRPDVGARHGHRAIR